MIPIAIQFITTQGRMKYIRPLYRALFNSCLGKDIAVATFLRNKDFYHPIAAKMIAADLGVSCQKVSEVAGGEKRYGEGNDGGNWGISWISTVFIFGGLFVVSAAARVLLATNRRR